MSSDPTSTADRAYGTGLATIDAAGTVLDAYFPAPGLGADEPTEPAGLAELTGNDELRGVRTELVRRRIELATEPADAVDVYLRLHLLSHRLVRPHGLNLTGIFGLLTTVVWTNHGPCPVAGFERTRTRLRARGPVTVYGLDKFPRMVDYVLPDRRPDRRRRPGPAGRPPGRRHHRDA